MNPRSRVLNRSRFRHVLGSAVAMMMVGCVAGPTELDAEKVQNIDNTSQQLLQQRLIEESAKLATLQRTLREQLEKTVAVAPEPLAPSFNPLDAVNISFSADAVDIRSIFKAIADQAGLNLVLPESLSLYPRTISLALNDVPASQAFDRVLKSMDMSGLVTDNMLLVQEFEEQVFDLDFLLTMSTADFSAGGDVFGAASSTGSGLTGGESVTGNNGLSSSFTISGRNTNDINPYEQIDLMLASLIFPDGAADGFRGMPRETYMLNRSTGTLFVRARPSQLESVSRLVGHYKAVLGRQVLIEAQILDVELNDQFRYGVDWSILRGEIAASYSSSPLALGEITSNLGDAINAGRSVVIPASTLGDLGGRSLAIAQSGRNHNIGLDLMKTFGTVHILSNPSIRVRNTQPAVVSVGSNMRYIAQSSSNTQSGSGGLLATTANVVTSNVFDGVLLGVIPFISDDGSIHLTINPMQTSVQPDSMTLVDVGSEQNPMKISLPRVDFKGMTTSLSLNNGDMVILGGLISENGSEGRNGIPGLSDVPVLGQLLSGKSNLKSARELVLVLRVEIL